MTVSAFFAAMTPSMPPGWSATTSASAPPRNAQRRLRLPSSSSASGREAVKYRSPLEEKAAEDSPVVPRVSRRAGAEPAGSTDHRAVR
jgi:hypothetical protein